VDYAIVGGDNFDSVLDVYYVIGGIGKVWFGYVVGV